MTNGQNEAVGYKYAVSQPGGRRQLQPLAGLIITVNPASTRSLLTVELPLLALMAMIFSVSFLVAPAGGLAWIDEDLPQLFFCPFLVLTGIPCFFCGITRSFLAMGHLQLSQALIFHPLGPLFYLALAALALLLIFSLAGRRQIRFALAAPLKKRLWLAGLSVLLAAWLVKLVVWSQVGLLDL